MQRHGDGLGCVVQNACRAVALVHIAVEDQHPVYPASLQQVAADHGQVVENAEAGGVVVMGVVGAASEVAGNAVLQRHLGGQQRATYRAYGAPGQGFAPGQAEAALVLGGQFSVHVAFDVAAVVGQGEDLVGADVRAQQGLISGQPAVDQVVVQQAELVHREAVFGGELRAVVFVVDQRQRHGWGRNQGQC